MNWRRTLSIAVAVVLWRGPSNSAIAATTWDVPGDFPTIQAAIDAAAPGDTIRVGPGLYVGTVRFNGKAVTVQSTHGPEATTLDGNGATVVGIGPGGELIGFTITGGSAPFGAGMEVDGVGSLIRGNIFEANHQTGGGYGAGIGGNYASPTIEGNIFRYNTADDQWLSGVVCFINSSSPRIANNVFEDNPCRAINLALPNNTRPEVVNNTIVRNELGIYVSGINPSIHTYRNNIVVDNVVGVEGGYASGGADPCWQNNLVFGNTVDYNGPTDLTGQFGNLSADPHFVDPAGDYRLLPSSPAVDTGSPVAAPGDDRLGLPRPVDGNGNGYADFDMGAHEYVPSGWRPPQIGSIDPAQGPVWSQIRISGSAFGTARRDSVVVFGPGQVEAAEYFSWSDTAIACRVPEGLSTGDNYVAVIFGPESNAVPFNVTAPAALCVDAANATGKENGTPLWPFNTLGEAMTAATGGATIKLPGATFPGSLTISGKRLTLRGGYVGGAYPGTGDFSETTRNPAAHPTVLDGGGAPVQVACQDTAAQGSVLDGLTIRNSGATFRGGVVLRQVRAGD